MYQVGTHDRRWQLDLDWSTANREWTVALSEYRRSGPFSDWQLEERWCSPMVAAGHLADAVEEGLQVLAELVGGSLGEQLLQPRPSTEA